MKNGKKSKKKKKSQKETISSKEYKKMTTSLQKVEGKMEKMKKDNKKLREENKKLKAKLKKQDKKKKKKSKVVTKVMEPQVLPPAIEKSPSKGVDPKKSTAKAKKTKAKGTTAARKYRPRTKTAKTKTATATAAKDSKVSGSNGKPAAKTRSTTKKASATKTTRRKASTAKKQEGPKRPDGPEDLKFIQGMGEKIESLLKAKGIKTFADLAKASQSSVKEVLQNSGPRYKNKDPKPIIEQAKLIKQEKWNDLEKMQAKMNEGRAKPGPKPKK